MTKSPWANFCDEFGRTIDTSLLGEEVATPQIWGTRRVIGEEIASGLTPAGLAEVLRQASNGYARAYLTLAEEMEERYGHYASQVQTRKLAIEGVPVTIEHDERVPAKIVDAVNELVEPSAFDDLVASLTDAIAKSYSVSELMWDFSAGLLRPAEYKWRDPRFFQFDEATQTELRLADMSDARNGLQLPAAKFVMHMPRSKMGLPIRRGIARPAAWAYLIQAFSLADWASFAEIYGVPLRVGKYGPGALEGDKRALLMAVRAIANDAAAIIPAGMEIEFHKVEGQHGAGVFGGLIDYVDKQVSKIVLGQTMTSDSGSSHAQAKVHDEVRIDIKRADCKQIATTINRDLIVPFVVMNFGPQEVYPRVSFPVPDPEDVKELTEAVARLVPLGLKVSQREMREKVGLGEPEKDEELLVAPAAAPVAPPAGQQALPPQRTPPQLPAPADWAKLAAPAASGDAIDRSIEALLAREGWSEMVAPIVGGLDAELAAATSIEEARAILAARFRQMTPETLAETLTDMVFAARLLGEADAASPDF